MGAELVPSWVILVVLLAGFGAVFASVFAIWRKAKAASATFRAGMQQTATTALTGIKEQFIRWAFTEEEGEIPDPDHPGQMKKVRIRKPSPAFAETVQLIIPEFIGQGMLFLKEHPIKLGDAMPAVGGVGGAIDAFSKLDPKVLKKMGISEEQAGWIQLIGMFKDQIGGFLGGFLGKGPAVTGPAGAGAEVPKYVNPFLGK